MHNFDSAFKTVSELVNDFKANERKYLYESEVYKVSDLTEEEIKIVEGNG